MLVDKIKEYQQKDFGINDTNKKQYGEVFTSFPLIIKILNRLPIELCSNPSLTWLDPCCGVEHFTRVVLNDYILDYLDGNRML